MTRDRDYFMRTARLGFRHWSENDLSLAVALWGDPEVTKLIGGPFSEDVVKKKLAAEMNSMAHSDGAQQGAVLASFSAG